MIFIMSLPASSSRQGREETNAKHVKREAPALRTMMMAAIRDQAALRCPEQTPAFIVGGETILGAAAGHGHVELASM